MFWGVFKYGMVSELVPAYGDPEAVRGGVTARVYREILEEYLPTMMEDDTIFMQDNAPIHTAKLVKEYLTSMGFRILKWPPYSPDLNPIENVWKLLKDRIFERDPNLGKASKNEQSLKRLCQLAEEVWLDLEIELINKLVDSLPRRLEAVRNVGGWYTKY